MADANAESDAENGYAKSAGPVVAAVGGLIGIVVAATLFWYVVGHHTSVGGNVSSQLGERSSSLPVNFKGMAVPTSTNYVYRVVGPLGATAEISYAKPDGSDAQIRVTLPWSIAVSASVNQSSTRSLFFVSANSTVRGPGATVTCQTFIHGALVSEETDKGPRSSVVCSGF